MKDRVQGAVTAGVALVGAGVMAVTPAAQEAPEVLRSVEADVQLTAAPAPYDQSVPELFALSAQRSVTGLASAPVGLATAAIALAQGTPAGKAAAQAILNEIVDGPQWAADPAIYAFDDLLPEPIGGDDANDPTKPDEDSAISQFRADVLIAARDDIKEAIGDSLGLGHLPDVDDEGPVYAAARLGAGLAVSGVRAVQSSVTAPLGLVAVAQGVQESFNGNNKPLYQALQAYIDGPNYVTDPIVFAVDDVLPKAAGGSDPQTDPTKMNGSEISRLRGNVLLAPRDTVRKVVAGSLGVDPVSGNPVPAASIMQADKTADTSDRTGPVSRIIKSLRATPGGGASTEAATTGGKHRALTTGGLSGLFKKKADPEA